MLTRRSLLRGVGQSALGIGLGGALAAPRTGPATGLRDASVSASPRPDQRDPTADDDRTQGNIVGRLWLNGRTGRLWQATDVTPQAALWSDQGVPPLYPGDAGTWSALLGTKPLTSAYANGIKPFVDVYAVGADLQPAGPFTINFIDGAVDTATIRALQGVNPATAGLPENAMCVLKLLLVSRWYDQSGNNQHYTQLSPFFMPALWLIHGTADGTGEDTVHIAFSRAPPVAGYRPCDRHLVSTKGSLNTRNTTIYAVCQPHEASNDQSDPSLFGSSLDINGIQVAAATIDLLSYQAPQSDGIANWRLVNREASITTSATAFSTSPTVLSISLSASRVEFTANDDMAILPALPDARGAGSVIGAGYKSWNSGSPATGTGGHGFYGAVDAVLVRATADDARTTKAVRGSLHRAFRVVPQAANDTVVVEGDSGTVSWGGVFPLIAYADGGKFHLADVGVDGYGLNWMNQRKLSRPVRYVQLGRVGCGWFDPSTDTHSSSFYNRLPALRAHYRPSAKRNICVVYSHGMGIKAGDPHSAAVTYGLLVSWLDALRAGGQDWTVIIGLVLSTEGAGFDDFNNLLVKNAAPLDISYFAELTPAQISAVKDAPNGLVNLYAWNEPSARYGGHGSPLLYALQSDAWAQAINAVL